jgi:hypothetical protein
MVWDNKTCITKKTFVEQSKLCSVILYKTTQGTKRVKKDKSNNELYRSVLGDLPFVIM